MPPRGNYIRPPIENPPVSEVKAGRFIKWRGNYGPSLGKIEEIEGDPNNPTLIVSYFTGGKTRRRISVNYCDLMKISDEPIRY